MCGIAGVFGKCDTDTIGKMIEAMRHRGPDYSNVIDNTSAPATLGHSRLSIIDISPAGRQPMQSEGRPIWITYNGEIYNYRELRHELSQKRFRFHSDSDTEVALYAYEEWGPAFLERLRGMFSIAILDCANLVSGPKLILARDRFGIKPLWYLNNNSCFWFSSEIRPLFNIPGLKREIAADAMAELLTYGSSQQNRSILSGATALPPGSWMEITSSSQFIGKYWDLHSSTAKARFENRNISPMEAQGNLRSLLTSAAKYHMIADVPVGAFLSGGLDSSAVTALLKQHSSAKLKTFCIGFDTHHPEIEESHIAKKAAEALATDHTNIIIEGARIPDLFKSFINDLDQPSIDGFNTWLVSETARHSVTVAVSGLGGDELFAGYPHFRLLADAYKASPSGQPILHKIWKYFRSKGIRGMLIFYNYIRSAPPQLRYGIVRRILPENLQNKLGLEYSNAETKLVDGDSIQQTSYNEISNYMLNTLLRDTDTLSMAHSLEIRPLLLDHEIAEFVYSLPANIKIDKQCSKPLLRNALRDILPPMPPRPKMGFDLPFRHWLATYCRDMANDILRTDTGLQMFPEASNMKYEIFLVNNRNAAYLWNMIVLIEWTRTNQMALKQ